MSGRSPGLAVANAPTLRVTGGSSGARRPGAGGSFLGGRWVPAGRDLMPGALAIAAQINRALARPAGGGKQQQPSRPGKPPKPPRRPLGTPPKTS